jgi:hypothetical protein
VGCKTNLRQFERCIKYTKEDSILRDIVDKYISIINDILSKMVVTERGSQYFDETQKK